MSETSDYQRIVDFLMRQSFFTDSLEKSLKEIKINPNDKANTYASLLNAHIFEPDEKGKTPFDYFLTHANLTTKQKELYEFWRENTFFSLFEVLEVGKLLLIQDIISHKSYKALSFPQGVNLKPGILITARIVPRYEKKNIWIVLAGSATSYPKEAIEILKNELSKNTYEPINELELIKYAYTQQP